MSGSKEVKRVRDEERSSDGGVERKRGRANRWVSDAGRIACGTGSP